MAARTTGSLGRRQSTGSPKAKPKAKSSLAPPARPKARARPLHAEAGTQTELRLPSMSLRSMMRSGKSEKSEKSDLMDIEDGSPMPFQLTVAKADSGNTSGTSDDPRTPVRRNSWELSSLDPSTWPVFGITNEGIGITTNDGQTLDVEKSADFGFDRTIDSHHLASIMEGIESGMLGESSFTTTGIARSREDALAKAEAENESFRHLCWDLISLGRDLEEACFEEPPSHEELLEEARHSLELVRQRLEHRKQLSCQMSPTEAVPEMEVPAPESAPLPSRGGSLKLVHPEAGPGGSGSLPFTLSSPLPSPTQPETRSLVASCSAPTLPWSACCPVGRGSLTPTPTPQMLSLSLPPAPLPLSVHLQRSHSPQVVNRDSALVQVPRFNSDGLLQGSSAQYPCEPVTRAVSPLREYQPPGTATSGASVSFAGYPPAMRPRATTQPGAAVAQRHYRQLWIGSWIRRTSCYETPKVMRMGSHEGTAQCCN